MSNEELKSLVAEVVSSNIQVNAVPDDYSLQKQALSIQIAVHSTIEVLRRLGYIKPL